MAQNKSEVTVTLFGQDRETVAHSLRQIASRIEAGQTTGTLADGDGVYDTFWDFK